MDGSRLIDTPTGPSESERQTIALEQIADCLTIQVVARTASPGENAEAAVQHIADRVLARAAKIGNARTR